MCNNLYEEGGQPKHKVYKNFPKYWSKKHYVRGREDILGHSIRAFTICQRSLVMTTFTTIPLIVPEKTLQILILIIKRKLPCIIDIFTEV